MRAHPAAALTATLLIFTACTAKDIDGIGKYDSAPPTDGPASLEASTSCDGAPTLAAPVVNPKPPASYAHKILPIRGTATGASLVGAQATSGTAKPATVGSSGNFCIEVDLVIGSNSIKLYGVDAAGCLGRTSAGYTVKYTPVKPTDIGTVKPANVAKGKTISKDTSSSISGSLGNVNDGSTTTSAKFSFQDLSGSACDKCAWVMIDLGKVYTVSKFRIRWASDAGSEYATCHTILTAANKPAQSPDCTTNAGWTVTHKETAGIAVPKDITVQPVSARYVAFLVYENASTWLYENFKLAEFEAWGVDPGAVTPPLPDRCK